MTYTREPLPLPVHTLPSLTVLGTASNSDVDGSPIARPDPTSTTQAGGSRQTIESPTSSSPGEITPFVTPAPISTANGTQRSHSVRDRLTLVSPGPETDQPIEMPTPPTPAESSRKARRQQRAEAQAGFVQETDAGRVALLPPSYDPAWAQEGLPDATTPSDGTTEAREAMAGDGTSATPPVSPMADLDRDPDPESSIRDTQHTEEGVELDSTLPSPETHANNNPA